MSEGAEDAPSGVTPSGRGVFAGLADVATRTSDGGYQAPTVYAGSAPLATLVPYQEPVVWQPVAADVMVRLSRFAYLRRVGHDIRVETPLSVMYLDVHDPRAAAIVSALAFDRTAADVADMVGLPVDAVQGVLGLLRAMNGVDTVVEQRDPSAPVAATLQWAASGGVPGAWWTPQVQRALAGLPWDQLGDRFEILWELHHLPAERQVDVSVSIPSDAATGAQRMVFREFDLREDGSVLMGEFFVPEPLVAESAADRVRELAQQLRARGHAVDWSDSGAVAQLLESFGTPAWVGITPEREGVRLVMPVVDATALAGVEAILTSHGVSLDVVARLGLFASVVGGPGTRLAVDAVGDSIGPRIGFEITTPRAVRLVPGLLDALGIDPEVVAEVEAVALDPQMTLRLEHIPGVQTDEHARVISHVKVTFEADGDVSVKTYISLRNLPLAVGGRSVEDVDVPPTWEFHDLLFHARTRNGRVRDRLGGTARFSIVPEMATFSAQPMPGDIVLPAIDVPGRVVADLPFGEVIRARESDRDWTGPEIPVDRLSELLARVMEVIPREMDLGELSVEFDGQPYPSGGGLYEVDVVVIAHRVSGLEPGAYLYRRGAHSLEPLEGDLADVDLLLFGAAEATGNGVTRPQALLILAARFPDLAVKYQGIAYALMLKHVGVLQATIAYTATAVGLGAVPLGTGDSDAFARATGLDYYTQGSIGEIAVSEPPLS